MAGEFVGRLLAVAHGKRVVQIQIGRFLHQANQFRNWNLGKNLARARREPHVTAEQAGVGLADSGQRLAGDEMHDGILIEAGVRLAPAQNGQIQHNQ